MLVPPDNFGLVEPGVYRCSKLEQDHFPFLETLQLKLLILLDAAKPPRTLKTFLSANNVELYNLGGLKISNHQTTGSGKDSGSETSLEASKPDAAQTAFSEQIEVILLNREKSKNDLWMVIEKNLIVAALEIILDRTSHNVLLVDSSLTLVGILRKIQKWNFNSIVNEYRIFTGNSSKNSYNVEVFLELIQIELVPYEVDQLQRRRDESAVFDKNLESPDPGAHRSLATTSRQCGSIDEGLTTGDEDDGMEDYEDDVDDDILSASPQIPANLLKLVEQRRNDDNSPAASPDYRRGSLTGSPNLQVSRRDSNDPTSHQRRKSSVDSRYIRSNNSRFRDPNFAAQDSPGRRLSFETSLRQYRLNKEKITSEDIQRAEEKYGYRYYKPNTASNVDVIKIRLPPEHKLSSWFVQGCKFWENFTRDTHN